MPPCILVDPGALWAGLKEALKYSLGISVLIGGLLGVMGWRRPTRMAWLYNRMLLGVVVTVVGPISMLFVLAEISDAITFWEAPGCHYYGLRFLLDDVGAPLVAILLILVGTYVLILRQAAPFLVKRTGNRAVDEAVARYRKAGEEALIGRPRLVVDGVGYYQVLYMPEGAGEEAWQEAEFLVLREDGQVVEDEALAVRVMRVGNAALELGEPGKMEYRWWKYKEALPRLARGLREVARQLRQMLKGARQLGKYEAIRGDLRRLQRVLVVMEPFVERQRKDLEVLARWSWAKKGPKMKELSEEEVEAMEEELGALRYWTEDEGRIRAMEEGEEAWRRLREWLRGPGGRRLADEEPWTYEFLEEVVGIWEDEEGFGIPQEAWEKARRGELRWFKAGDEEDIASWRRRLAWVREVEGRRAGAQGAQRV